MAKRRKETVKFEGPDTGQYGDEDDFDLIKEKVEVLKGLLNPYESYINRIQSVLIWENPKYTICLLLTVNVLFWLATSMRIYYLTGLVGVTVVFLDMWFKRIWPEIKVPIPKDEDSEGWTSVHPDLLSVPELSCYLAEIWLRVASCISFLVHLRQKSHFRFFLLMVSSLLCLAVFGCYVSGIKLTYITVMGILLWPAVVYHGLFDKAFAKIQPMIKGMEEKFRIKRKSPRKGKKNRRRSGTPPAILVDETDSETELEPFVPPPDHKAVKALSKATNESEEESPMPTPGLLTPNMGSTSDFSKEYSDSDSNFGDSETSFARGLSGLPSINTLLDDALSDTTSLDPQIQLSSDIMPSISQVEAGGDNDSMLFVPSHFEDSDEGASDRDDNYSQGLSFPDIQDVPDSSRSPSATATTAAATEDSVAGTSAQVLGQVLSSVNQEIVSQTVSNLMSSTIAGLSNISKNVMGTASDASLTTEASFKSPQIVSSADSETIDEEFEFLDEDDLDTFEADGSSKSK